MKTLLSIYFSGIIVLVPLFLGAQPGSLDITFGVDGIVTTAIGSSDDRGQAVAIQSDGKIVVAGTSRNGFSDNFAVVRYLPEGSLDTTFSFDGMVTTDFDSEPDAGASVAIQQDGKIVVAGTASYSSQYFNDFALARYLPDGSLDIDFDLDGKVTTSISPYQEEANAVVIQPDGKIVVGGFSQYVDSRWDFTLVRYLPDGSLDHTFGFDGVVTTDIDSFFDELTSLALQPDGKIVAAGNSDLYPSNHIAVARYLADGSLDLTFNFDGVVTTDINADFESANSVAIQADGKIVVAGSSGFGSDADFAVVRYLANGSLDPSFSLDGVVTTDINSNMEEAKSVIIQPDGKIIIAGYSQFDLDNDFALLRYLADGSLDQTFNSDGVVTTDINSDLDVSYAAALQPDGKIITAGTSLDGSANHFAVARYLSGLNVGILDLTSNEHSSFIYPNPITGSSATLGYELQKAQTVSIFLTGMDGKVITSFIQNEKRNEGAHKETIVFPSTLSAGMYLLRTETEKELTAVKVTIIK